MAFLADAQLSVRRRRFTPEHSSALCAMTATAHNKKSEIQKAQREARLAGISLEGVEGEEKYEYIRAAEDVSQGG